MNHALVLPVIALSLLAGLLAAGPEPEAQPPPRAPDDPADLEAVLDDLAREIAREEGRLDPQRLRHLLEAATRAGQQP
jgi:hypothetical protein